MHFILQDSSKFENYGLSSETDNIAKIEAHIQSLLLSLTSSTFVILSINAKSTNIACFLSHW